MPSGQTKLGYAYTSDFWFNVTLNKDLTNPKLLQVWYIDLLTYLIVAKETFTEVNDWTKVLRGLQGGYSISLIVYVWINGKS